METHHCPKIAAALLVFASSILVQTSCVQTALAQTAENEIHVTSASGESWLTHLHRTFDETSMGKTGQLGPASASPRAELRWQMTLAPESANETVTLHGSDLYRMNCRGCHGTQGMGAPPEINSVINPVRATSAAAVMERMKTAGMDISPADAAQLAGQSKGMLLERLHHGGQDMPAFPHLRDEEVDSLVACLRQLAGVRGAEGEQLAVREPRVRVGEHIVKSTCHICHSASGPNPNPEQLYQGAIPPLNTLTQRTTRAEFIRKVTHGAPIVMGTPPEPFRGRMPVFYYLSEEEAADVYLYLTRYPPYEWATLDPSPTAIAANTDAGGPESATTVVSGPSFVASAAHTQVRSAATADPEFPVLPILAGFMALVLLGLGFAFTVCEMKRLSAKDDGRKPAGANVSENTVAPDAEAHPHDGIGSELVG